MARQMVYYEDRRLYLTHKITPEDRECFRRLHRAYIDSLLPDQGAICIDAYRKMAQIVGQRQEGARLVIELDQYSPIATGIPKHLIAKYDDVLTIVYNDSDWLWEEAFFYFGG